LALKLAQPIQYSDFAEHFPAVKSRSTFGCPAKISLGLRNRQNLWNGADSGMKPKRNAAAEPQTEVVAEWRETSTNVARDERGLRSGTGAVVRGKGPTSSPVERSKTVRWSR